MRAAVFPALALTLLACDDHASKLDESMKKPAPSADPWSATFPRKDGDSGSGDSGGGGFGFDIQGILERVKESIETPGPYEAPKHSKDYAEDKPHWGVIGLSGSVLEREAF